MLMADLSGAVEQSDSIRVFPVSVCQFGRKAREALRTFQAKIKLLVPVDSHPTSATVYCAGRPLERTPHRSILYSA